MVVDTYMRVPNQLRTQWFTAKVLYVCVFIFILFFLEKPLFVTWKLVHLVINRYSDYSAIFGCFSIFFRVLFSILAVKVVRFGLMTSDGSKNLKHISLASRVIYLTFMVHLLIPQSLRSMSRMVWSHFMDFSNAFFWPIIVRFKVNQW